VIAPMVERLLADQARDDSAHAASRRTAQLIALCTARLGPATYLAMENGWRHATLDEAGRDALDAAVADMDLISTGAARGMVKLLEEWALLCANPERRLLVGVAFDDGLMRSMAPAGGGLSQ